MIYHPQNSFFSFSKHLHKEICISLAYTSKLEAWGGDFCRGWNTEIHMCFYTYSTHLGSVNFTHTLLVQTHTHDVSAPWSVLIHSYTKRLDPVETHQLHWIKLMVFPFFLYNCIYWFLLFFIFFLLFLLDFYSPFLLYKILRFFLFQCKSEYSENIIIISRLCVNAVWLNIKHNKLFPT